MTTNPRIRLNINWTNRLTLFLVLALLMPAIAGLAGLVEPAVDYKAQPQLLELAASQPAETVRIIVQKQAPEADIASLIAELGGSVVADLRIINAAVAEMSAAGARQLAASSAVRWVSLDAPVVAAQQGGGGGNCSSCVDTRNLLSIYVQAIGATQLWNQVPYLQGQGITVAVVDSGYVQHDDLNVTTRRGSGTRVLEQVKFNSFTNSQTDSYGHSAHVQGIIGGNGSRSAGAQIGVAPKVNLVVVKVTDDRGAGTTADVINGLQWVLDNKSRHNIRVVNLSLNSSLAESYHVSPLNAAVEILWFNGIVVVVSAGNNGSGANNGILFPPANDPFVITVGATNDRGTVSIADDTLAPFSAYGVTADGFTKPDIVAPGTNIISLLASNNAELVRGHPEHRVDGFAGGRDYYFRMSGTSMSAAVVSGAVALLLQDEPGLTPDQVKHRLMATARPFSGPAPGSTGAGYLDIQAAVNGTTTASANTGIAASQLLWTGSQPITWNSVNWNSVNWNSVNWNSVNWNSVNWNSVNWNSVSWDN